MLTRIKPINAILETAEQHALRRSLGPISLMLLGIGTIIGTGIFVLTAEAAQKAGPAMIVSFCIAGLVCAFAALCYAEMAAMVPVSGSAYTYSYAVVGELLAWAVGWALILEYAIASGAVAVGWSGYFVGLLRELFGLNLPPALTLGPLEGGVVNVPAALLVLFLMGLLLIGTRESARFNAALVLIKISALTLFCSLALPVLNANNFHPFAPAGLGGISGAAASIFFAYVGFDAVATAAEETRDPQRNLPIGLIGSLFVCTLFYVLVASGVIGTVGAQPLLDAAGRAMALGSGELAEACRNQPGEVLVCSKEALAWVLRSIGWQQVGNLMGLVAGFALPSVVLMTMFGQTRIFFAMSRDGLLPKALSRIHPRFHTPYVVTLIAGSFIAVFAALFPVGMLADVSNSGTLFAFMMVAVAVLILRRRDPERHRPFRAPGIGLVAPLAILGCLYLFLSLSPYTLALFVAWALVGLVIYFAYGCAHSHVGVGEADRNG